MNYSINPFQELYVADTLSADHFVHLFSEVPMQSVVQPLFQGSNVVLSGTQGCGKTMLLSLLRPEIREAYYRQGIPFPIKGDSNRFISAGVNLTSSAICDVGQVTLGESPEHDIQQLPYFFADFFNYWVIRDLLENVIRIGNNKEVFGDLVKLNQLNEFVQALVKQDCWFGGLDGCKTFDEVQDRIRERVTIYRRWVSGNEGASGAPNKIRHSKTAIGEPILRTVECLKQAQVIDDIPVFIRVDQLEELHQEARGSNAQLRTAFRFMLNRAFGNRNQRVVYRLGTRKYGWKPEDLIIHGSGAKLEARRDYLLIDMDELFRRKEREKDWVFEQFATDAFERRVKYFLKIDSCESGVARKVFGVSPSPKQRAEYFGKPKSGLFKVEQALAIDESAQESSRWSSEWRTRLKTIYESSPLDAVLAAAWGRQTGGPRSKKQHNESPPPSGEPWMKLWWRKERLMQGVLQLAARRQQRLLWWGYNDILALSGSNITAFIHICHEIWDLFLKEERLKSDDERNNPLFGKAILAETQAAGIQSASSVWYRKLGEQPGGDVRRRFIENLGKQLRRSLREDKRMSYPGGNGISLNLKDLELNQSPNIEMWRFLSDAVGYGDLVAADHTTKNKASETRRKFYLNPILSPAFQLPAAHTKEPLYWRMNRLLELARVSELPFALEHIESSPVSPEDDKSSPDARQLGLL